MKSKGYIKRVFPGGNTSVGFYSYFEYIIDQRKAAKIYYIKGGPGVGKSYMMKKIGYDLLNKGYDVEFHHCAADPDSLDAIVVPDLKIALMDGTAPHVQDPRYPGVTGKTVNLGVFLKESSLEENREKIIRAIDENGKIYKTVYKYLAAAKLIHDDIEWHYGQAMDFKGVNKVTEVLLKNTIDNAPDKGRIGYVRHLFGSAYTLKGHIDHGETFIGAMEKIIYVKGEPGTGKSTLLEKIGNRAIEKGYDIEMYHEPLVPEKVEGILVPELNLAVTINNKYMDKETIDLNEFIESKKIKPYEKELAYSEKLFDQLIQDVFDNLQRTKKNHDEIEQYYVPNISFEELDRARTEIVEEIYSYEEKN